MIIQSECVTLLSKSNHKKLTEVYGIVYQTYSIYAFLKTTFIRIESSILSDFLTSTYGQDSDHQNLTYADKKVNY